MVALKDFFTRKIGFWIMGIGLFLFLATPLFLWLWDVDTDIWGAMIFIVGLVFALVRWNYR